MAKTLNLMASIDKDALYPNIAALNGYPPQRRFIGWTFDATIGEAGGWIRKTELETVPYHNDYVKAVKEGDLLAADEQTAILCGVSFISKTQISKTTKDK